MSKNNKQRKPLFKLVIMPENIFVQAPRPKRNTVIVIVLIILLIIVLIVASNEPELHRKAMELVISIVEAIVTFFTVSPRDN